MGMTLQEKLATWHNLTLAYRNASRGKRGRATTAAFELYLGDHLVELRCELGEQTWQPGGYRSFYIQEPKKRLISAAFYLAGPGCLGTLMIAACLAYLWIIYLGLYAP